MNSERDEEICRLFVDGMSLHDCSVRFGVSHERIRQILRKAKVFKGKRPLDKSDRDEFLGVNLTEADKIRLRAEAGRRGMSMSMLTSDLIRDMLNSLQEAQ